jgi:enoyl-CoA hydratase
VVRGVKDVLAENHRAQVEAGLRYVSTWNSAFLPSKDLGEAVQAFMERREAHFTGE